jgi:hypothetical protein
MSFGKWKIPGSPSMMARVRDEDAIAGDAEGDAVAQVAHRRRRRIDRALHPAGRIQHVQHAEFPRARHGAAARQGRQRRDRIVHAECRKARLRQQRARGVEDEELAIGDQPQALVRAARDRRGPEGRVALRAGPDDERDGRHDERHDREGRRVERVPGHGLSAGSDPPAAG